MSIASQLLHMRERLKQQLDQARRDKLAKLQALRLRSLQRVCYGVLFGSNLAMLALVNKTDKWGRHYYTQHYDRHFRRLRRRRLNILEIGIGGWKDPELGGGSLRMWRTYFPRARIYGIDVFCKTPHDERRIKTFMGSQVDERFLDEVLRTIGSLDIVIDDGSHVNRDVLRTFELLFPRLASNGIYVIEDTQTSYWQQYGGSSVELDKRETTMGFVKSLLDGLNYEEFEPGHRTPSYYDENIIAIHCYHNLVFIQKGRNGDDRRIVKARA